MLYYVLAFTCIAVQLLSNSTAPVVSMHCSCEKCGLVIKKMQAIFHLYYCKSTVGTKSLLSAIGGAGCKVADDDVSTYGGRGRRHMNRSP